MQMANSNFTTEELNNEIWLPVVGYEGVYSVSNLGRVRREGGTYGARKSRILRQPRNRYGYPQAGLSRNCRTSTKTVHRLVALAFLGKPPSPEKNNVNHLDHDRTNNRLENLEWCSPKENTQHCLKAGRHIRGMRQKDAKLIDDDIPIIRYLLERGCVLEDIARCFSVSVTGIHRIKTGQLWKHIPQPEKVGLFD